ncbi:MAG: HAD-IIB family hydrolase [Acutalibacteraceae bacterium]
MAKRYDGTLLITDLDGTMISSDGSVSAENCEAIARFQQNGGTFSVATGRLPTHFAQFADTFVPNAPVITFNGAGIYDLSQNKMICCRRIPVPLAKLMHAAEPFAAEMESVILNSESRREYLPWAQAQENLPELDREAWLKMIFVFREEAAAVRAQLALRRSSPGEFCDFSRSWCVGVEVLDKQATKGCAVKVLRAMLPQINRVVCIGDYENDLSMLREADLGVAVGNALEVVKQAADRVTVTNNENAIAALIDSL